MQLRKLLLPGLLSVTLLSGCSLFNSEEDGENVATADGRKPVYAVHVLEHLRWRRYWRILSNLHPAFADGVGMPPIVKAPLKP